jgi:prolyl-tRNA editing enzyme YbaK/EbsC (Cys-tRNA(Pro) deacylase)
MSAASSADSLDGLPRFERFMAAQQLEFSIIDCGTDTLTVTQAAAAIGCDPAQIIKTLLFHDAGGHGVVAIAAGPARIDAKRLAKVAGTSALRLARPDHVWNLLGYPAGGVPPLDLPEGIPVIVDSIAARLGICYAGAGTTQHLARVAMRDIIRVNSASVQTITQAPSLAGGPGC